VPTGLDEQLPADVLVHEQALVSSFWQADEKKLSSAPIETLCTLIDGWTTFPQASARGPRRRLRTHGMHVTWAWTWCQVLHLMVFG